MGKVNLFIVFVAIIVVGTSFISIHENSDKITEMMNNFYQDLQVRSMSAFSLNYGIHKLQNGDIEVNDEIAVLHTPNYAMNHSTIDSILFSPGEGDTVQILPFVRGNYQNIQDSRESSATLGFAIAPPENMFAYYEFEDGSGSTVTDISGYGYDGTMVNMNNSDWVTGKEGYGIDFDGVNDYIELGEEIAQEYDDKLTICSWIKSDSKSHQNWGNIATENSDGNGNQITGFTLRNKVKFKGRTSNHYITYEFEMTTTAGKEKVSLTTRYSDMDLLDWHFIAGIFDPENDLIKVGVVDENLWAVSSISSSAIPSRSPFSNITLGSIEGGGHGQGKKSGMVGTMDSFRLIADVLTPQELRMLMLYHGIKQPDLVDWKI